MHRKKNPSNKGQNPCIGWKLEFTIDFPSITAILQELLRISQSSYVPSRLGETSTSRMKTNRRLIETLADIIDHVFDTYYLKINKSLDTYYQKQKVASKPTFKESDSIYIWID